MTAKRMGIFRRVRLADGSYEIKDATSQTLAKCPSLQGAELIMRSMYAKWPMEHVTQAYVAWLDSPMIAFGTWPGDETDEELLRALSDIR